MKHGTPRSWSAGLLAACCVCGLALEASAEISNRIVAVVGDEVITETDVASNLAMVLEEQQARRPGGPIESQDIREAILDRLIEQRLVLQEAKRRGLAVTSDEVAARVELVRQRFPSDEAMSRGLAEAGLSREELHQQIRNQLLAEKAIDAAVRSKIQISPLEIAQAAERQPPARAAEVTEVWHLLVRVNQSRTEAQARARIEEARRALGGGEAFADVAARYSEDPNAKAGGALGWVPSGVLMPELNQAVFALKEGAVSEPIRTRLGFHLVKVGQRRTRPAPSAAATAQGLEQRLFKEKFQAELAKWLADLKQRAYIEIRPVAWSTDPSTSGAVQWSPRSQ